MLQKKCLFTMKGDGNDVKPSVSWSPDGLSICAGSLDNTVRLFNAERGKCNHILWGHTGAMNSVAWSPNSTRICSGSADGTVRVWDAKAQYSVERTDENYFTNKKK